MKKKGILIVSLFLTVMVFLPVYAKEQTKIKLESKSASAMWALEGSNDATYRMIISYIVSHRREGEGSIEKNAFATFTIGETINGNETWIAYGQSELSKDEFNLPSFSNGNKPSLRTTIRVNDSENHESFDVWIDLEWTCTGDKSKVYLDPPPDVVNIEIITDNIISCPAQATGVILRNDLEDAWINTSNPIEGGLISHQVKTIIFH